MKTGIDFLTDDFCRKLITKADPSLKDKVLRLSSRDLRKEAARLAAMTVEYWARFQPSLTDLPENEDARRVVPESVLARHGIPLDGFPSFDTGSRQDSSDPLRKILKWNGLDIGVTHEKGKDFRYGRKLVQYSYGHIRGSYGFAEDSKAVDVLLGPDTELQNLYRIRQLSQDGMLDEHKYGIGWRSPDDFRLAYQMQLPPELRDKLFGGVEIVSVDILSPYRRQEVHSDSCDWHLCKKKTKRSTKIKQAPRDLEKIEEKTKSEETHSLDSGSRADAGTKRIYVKDPSVKGGGYYRRIKVSKDIEDKSAQNKRSANPQRNTAIAISLAAAASAAIALYSINKNPNPTESQKKPIISKEKFEDEYSKIPTRLNLKDPFKPAFKSTMDEYYKASEMQGDDIYRKKIKVALGTPVKELAKKGFAAYEEACAREGLDEDSVNSVRNYFNEVSMGIVNSYLTASDEEKADTDVLYLAIEEGMGILDKKRRRK